MKQTLIIFIVIFFSFTLKAQISNPYKLQAEAKDIQKVIVETYYVSDANDATDSIGGILDIGSTTYRIYIQLRPGCKLLKLFGDSSTTTGIVHPLIISSTENFYNNLDRGRTFGKDIKKSDLKKGIVALDSWLTLGQTSTTKSGVTYFGVLKSQDKDSSFIGGINNDGGSSVIPGGLLKNNNSFTGIPLTTADGMDTMMKTPSFWPDNGFTDPISGQDSSVFGGNKPGNLFYSKNASLSCTGVSGVVPDSNQIIVAQLTTKGKISFEFNVEVLRPKNIFNLEDSVIRYVARGKDTLNEKISGWLKYPFACGCKNTDYSEYNPDFPLASIDSCKTKIVFGCMDPNACNYNPNANFNINEMCCYPGYCNGKDISIICPNLGAPQIKIKSYPNPVHDQLNLEISANDKNNDLKYIIYNSFGNVVLEKNIGVVSNEIKELLDISNLENGLYLVRLLVNNSATDSKTFIKY